MSNTGSLQSSKFIRRPADQRSDKVQKPNTKNTLFDLEERMAKFGEEVDIELTGFEP